MKTKLNFFFFLVTIFLAYGCTSGGSDTSFPVNRDPGASTGKAGSMARFAISGNRLFVVDFSDLRTYSLQNPSAPRQIDITSLNQQSVETIFPYGEYLFLGTQMGTIIVDVRADRPQILTTITHARACDPVIVHDSIAYVTLRDGTECNRDAVNRMDILDVKNILTPRIVGSVQMSNPHGLAVSGKWLFVCQGRFGFDVYNIGENPYKPVLVEKINRHHGFDVIALRDYIMVVGNDGLYQYGFKPNENLPELALLSKIVKSN